MLTETELTQLYRTHMSPLYGYVSRRVGANRPLTEDIVQETWLRAVSSWRARGTADQPRAWLFRVARNLLVSHFRHNRPQPVDTNEQASLIEAFHFEGRSIRDIATQTGLSERAVEGRLRRARQNLQKQRELEKRAGSN